MEALRAARTTAAPRGALPSPIFIDVDHFKAFNDSLGHPAGDQPCASSPRRIVQVRAGDAIVARYGGEEFACLLLNVEPGGCPGLAERIRASIRATRPCRRRDNRPAMSP